jgi:hypothetical protein
MLKRFFQTCPEVARNGLTNTEKCSKTGKVLIGD